MLGYKLRRPVISVYEILRTLSPLPAKKYGSSFVSASEPDRIKIHYYFNKNNQRFYARVVFGKKAQGPPEHAHGGAVAAVLDEAMGGVSWLNGFTVMTAKLEINYINALSLDTEYYIETSIKDVMQKKLTIQGKIVSKEGVIFAESKGLFIEKSLEHFKSMGKIPDAFLGLSSIFF